LRKLRSLFPSLENKGERVEIFFKSNLLLDDNEKCHIARYVFAKNFVKKDSIVADFACGTGYGSVMLAENAKEVLGADIDASVIKKIKDKYRNISNLHFVNLNLLELNYRNKFNLIVSFETIEHLGEDEIERVLNSYHGALADGGQIIISTPYMQKNDEVALKMGFHKTFFIDENKIRSWMEKSNFIVSGFYYQTYENPKITPESFSKDFVICVAEKK
jgi:cyclopropane fatty-acyl-phospholipid synthase-like methyltransferase